MDHLRSLAARSAALRSAPGPRSKKKTASLSEAFQALFERARPAFKAAGVFEHALVLALASIVALGRHTIAGTLTACGRQFEDWSAAYRIFERRRFDAEKLFGVSRRAVLDVLAPKAPLVVVLDDTLVRKRGGKVAEAGWHHDPQGPAFNHQIAWSQRLVQVCAMLPAKKDEACCAARAIPIGQVLQKAVKKPRRKSVKKDGNLSEAQQKEQEAAREKQYEKEQADYRKECRKHAAPGIGRERVLALRKALDDDGEKARLLLSAFDGGFTNKTLFKEIPPNTALVGRLRKDARLFAPPATQTAGRGRPRLYGAVIETPAKLLSNAAIAWQETTVFAAGRPREFEYKTVDRCRWKSRGGHDVRLIVVKPLSPTPHEAGRKLFFAHPGYLICSDPEIAIEQVLQAYVWRWEIEVGFREQKTQLGLGEAQTYTQPAVASVLEFQSFCYALLLLAAHQAELDAPPRPLWQEPPKPDQRVSCGQLISIMRAGIWGRALGLPNKTHFAKTPPPHTKSPKIQDTLTSAVLYATK